jgi:ParB family chromosome partitioning protein
MAKQATVLDGDDVGVEETKERKPIDLGGSSGEDLIGQVFDDSDEENQSPQFFVSINQLFIDKANNARNVESQDYSPESIASLAAKIRTTNGLLQPIVVTGLSPNEDTGFKEYLPVAGYRRIMALTLLAQETNDKKWIARIPARLADISDHASFALTQLFENLGRADLNPMETAIAFEKVIKESRAKITQANLASMSGMSQSQVSRYLSLIKLPEAIQQLVSNKKLSFANASLMLSGDYDFEDANQITIAKIGCRYTQEAFENFLDSRFSKKSKEGEVEPASKKKTTKGKSFVKSSEVEKIFVPYLKAKIAELASDETPDASEKKYTELDVLKNIARVRLDTISALQGDSTSAFATEIEPFKKRINELEEAEKEGEKVKKGKEKFISSLARRAKTLMNLPAVDGSRPFPNISSALVKIGAELQSLKQEDIDKLDFKLDIVNGTQDILNSVHEKYLAIEKESRQRREKSKEKEKEEAEKAEKDAKGAKGAKPEKNAKGAKPKKAKEK